jgi:hypothetical protein
MAWLPDHTGIQYYPKITRNSINEGSQIHIFIGFDDLLGKFFTGVLAGLTRLTHIVEIEAG